MSTDDADDVDQDAVDANAAMTNAEDERPWAG